MPLQSTSQKYRNYMFRAGLFPQYSAPADPSPYDNIVPLRESSVDLGGGVILGETPNSGATDMISQLIGTGVHLIGSSPGWGATGINGLSKGSAHYTRLMAQVSRAKALADTLPYTVPAVTWMQGETDQEVLTRSQYVIAETQLASDLAADISAITGQAPQLITYQIGGVVNELYGSYAATSISQAQLDCDMAGVSTVAMPMYQFDYAADGLGYHLTGYFSRVAGAYLGLCVLRRTIPGNAYYNPSWKCLRPTACHISGNDVVVTFNVPMGNLVFDTSWVTAAANNGFDLLDSGLNAVAITATSIVGNAVHLTCATPPVGGWVQYACHDWVNTTGRTAGPRGNLRDSQGDSIVFDPAGTNFPMHNWCVRFRMGIT
jgi:hypothetical protein